MHFASQSQIADRHYGILSRYAEYLTRDKVDQGLAVSQRGHEVLVGGSKGNNSSSPGSVLNHRTRGF